MTRDETSKLLAILRAMWPQAKIIDPEAMTTGYHLGLRDVSYRDAEQAVTACIEELTFMPTVAEIRQRLPKRGLDSTLYREFGALHGKRRSAEEQRRYAAVCRKLGIDVPAAPPPPRSVPVGAGAELHD